MRPCCAMFRSKSYFSDLDACIVCVAVVDLCRLWLLANHRGQHRPVCALRRSFMLLFVGSMCHHAADVSVNFMFGTTIFNQHQHWSSSGAMRVCLDNSCKEDASFRARFFLLLAWLTRIMFVYCSLAPGLFFLCVSIVILFCVHRRRPRRRSSPRIVRLENAEASAHLADW